MSGRNLDNPNILKGGVVETPETHFNISLNLLSSTNALLIVIKLSDLLTFTEQDGVLSARTAERPFVFAHGQLPRVLWGKDKGALGGQREAW